MDDITLSHLQCVSSAAGRWKLTKLKKNPETRCLRVTALGMLSSLTLASHWLIRRPCVTTMMCSKCQTEPLRVTMKVLGGRVGLGFVMKGSKQDFTNIVLKHNWPLYVFNIASAVENPGAARLARPSLPAIDCRPVVFTCSDNNLAHRR